MIDPNALPIIRAKDEGGKYQLKIHSIEPEKLIPNGDRYIVETIAVDELVKLGEILVFTPPPQVNVKDPMADPKVEVRGVIPAVVIAKGNGHLLGLPDAVIPFQTGNGQVSKSHADVPMFFNPGDIVFLDHNARGRALKIVNREIRIVNQIDILVKLDGIKLERKDGTWIEVDGPYEAGDPVAWSKGEVNIIMKERE